MHKDFDMSIISKFTHLILRNEMEFKFDGRNASDYKKSVEQILKDFRLELLNERYNNKQLELKKLENLHNPK